MLHPINPLIDCVFKSLFGDPAHKDLLLSLLNAVLRPEQPIRDVEILPSETLPDHPGDDRRITDVRARVDTGDQIGLEVQIYVRPWMASRVLYCWADLYQAQLGRGGKFRDLVPVVSIWFLGQNLLPGAPGFHHRFEVWDPAAGVRLSDHLRIHTLELQKWTPPAAGLVGEDAWMYFLKEGGSWHELPAGLRTPELELAMQILKGFSEKEIAYHHYQSRMNYLREEASLAEERAEMLAELAEQKQTLAEQKQILTEQKQILTEQQQALADRERALAEHERALSEERLRREALEARLRAAGLDP